MGGYLDLHAHWLPGIDDGVTSAAEGVALVRALGALGFDDVIATPHVRPGVYDNDRASIEAAFSRLRAELGEAGEGVPRVAFAAEHFLDDEVLRRLSTGGGVSYPGGKAVLVELSPAASPLGLEKSLGEIYRRGGMRPVLAHPERYAFVADDFTRLEPAMDAGALLLLDVAALVGKYGRRASKAAHEMLEAGYYYAACSDAHGPGDAAAVGEGIARLTALAGADEAQFLLGEGPRSIVEGRIEA